MTRREENEMNGQGYVLAGGKSRRMGEDKALLDLEGLTLVERAVLKLQGLGLGVTVVCARPEQAARLPEQRVILDRQPGLGPAAAVWTALKDSRSPYNYVLSCDTPLIPPQLFRELRKRVKDSDVAVPADFQGQIQPLCGLYARRAARTLEEYLNQGVLSITEIVQSGALRLLIIPARELGLSRHAFSNVNRREDLETVRRILADQGAD